MKYSKEEMEPIVCTSQSIAEILRKLGEKVCGGNYKSIYSLIKKHNIDTSHLLGKSAHSGQHSNGNRLYWWEVLTDEPCKSREDAKILRRSLIASGRDYQCEKCGNTGEWQGEILTLHVDHINGNPLNNRADNLRFLCPNCHTQTPTIGSKKRLMNKKALVEKQLMNIQSINEKCKHCGSGLPKSKLKFCSVTCSNRFNGAKPKPTKIKWPDQQSLTEMTEELGFSATGRILGVSDNAIRKRLRKTPS